MNLVLDTNVLVSGIMGQGTPPAVILGWFRNGTANLLADDRMLREYREVLLRPRLARWIRRRNAEAILETLEHEVRLLVPALAADGLPDAADAPFLEVAWTGGCPLITGNLRHFPARLRHGVRVLTPRQLLEENPGL